TRPALARTLVADTVGALATRVNQLRQQNAKLRSELSAASEDEVGGIVSLIRTVADELGIGFGWAALYFTGFLVLWHGQTPGKRLLGIRVVRLDGTPITWWVAFERFGGYLAGVFTGLLDYFLIVRDRNRQALHDKIVDTVVVWEPK
ncbi:MAG: RDD family protein, partial [Gemmatimonadota bacterium]|nr:RDD family protein [Gemmatimonadota bacterium]